MPGGANQFPGGSCTHRSPAPSRRTISRIKLRTGERRNLGDFSGRTAQQLDPRPLPVAGWNDQTNARKSLIDKPVPSNRSTRFLPEDTDCPSLLRSPFLPPVANLGFVLNTDFGALDTALS